MPALPQKISLLPEHLIDQIKAGEVIERPGNLIKEILENAIDAQASRIELTILNNGLDLISLKDNGQGILSSDLPLAFSRHATSKISRFEDIYHLSSFGFRGEALASIAAISKVHCTSFNAQETEGAEIRLEAGLVTYMGARKKTNGETGLELNIQELFFNTPARLKFIQSQQSEKNFVKKIIYSFVLSRPEIEFVLKINDDEKVIYPKRGTTKERILDLFPKSTPDLRITHRGYEQNEISIFLVPDYFKGPLKFQYTFINQRMVIDKQLTRVISQTMAAVAGNDNFHFLVFINLPSEHIDVNVHPSKTIIKIFESSKVISLLSSSIKENISSQNQKTASISTSYVPETSNQIEFSVGKSETLLQERHDYNMDGIFSPHHSVSLNNEADFIWLDRFFLHQVDGQWYATSAHRLLQLYVDMKLKMINSLPVPLLVSEPFKFSSHDLDRISDLNSKGIELEKLSQDTVVLRSIPEWLNSFPLKIIIGSLIKGQSLETTELDMRDWSKETWLKMIHDIDLTLLKELKIMSELSTLLAEKLK